MSTTLFPRFVAVMASGLLSLVLGGLTGISILWSWAGLPSPIPLGLDRHWLLMIFGFFLALIGNEVLHVLSLEWSGRAAPLAYMAPFAAMLWLTVAFTLAGAFAAAYLSSFVALLILLAYAGKVYLAPSRIGLRPVLYNYLLAAALAVSAVVPIFGLLGLFNAAVAALVFPIGTIFAVMARDISVVTGKKPARGWGNAVAFALIAAAFFTWAAGAPRAAGVLILTASALSLASSGLLRGVEVRYSLVQIYTAYFWLALSGIVLTATGGAGLWYDVAVHAAALGFIFNIVFGVDVVLMDMLAGQVKRVTVSIRRRGFPVAEAVLSALLNVGLLLRALYPAWPTPPLAALTGPAVGVAIVAFLLNMQRRLRGL